jgi:hypothetical protein
MPTTSPEDYQRLTREEFDALNSGDPAQVQRLKTVARLAGPSAFSYPGKGPVIVFFTSDGGRVRLSEGGRLIKYLEGQGMDITMDTVMSKTVYHVVKDVPGAAMGSGEIYLDTTPEAVPNDIPRFLQLVLETIGLRHGKYKDALIKLTRAGEDALIQEWDTSV